MTNAAKSKKEVRAKLFINGRSQAVRLPKEFRFEGTEVRVRRAMGGVLLEPVRDKNDPLADLRAMFARIDELRDGHLFPEREEQPPAEERDPIL
jgi:antitoxin VapB